MRELAEQVRTWAESLGYHCTVHDPVPGEPLLEMRNGDHRLILEPHEFSVQRLPAKAVLYSYPKMRRLLVVGPDRDGGWTMQSEHGIRIRLPWTAQGLNEVALELAA